MQYKLVSIPDRFQLAASLIACDTCGIHILMPADGGLQRKSMALSFTQLKRNQAGSQFWYKATIAEATKIHLKGKVHGFIDLMSQETVELPPLEEGDSPRVVKVLGWLEPLPSKATK